MNIEEYWIKYIKLQIHAARHLQNLSRYNINFELWHQNTREIMKSIGGPGRQYLNRFDSIRFAVKKTDYEDLAQKRERYVNGLVEANKFLSGCVADLGGAASTTEITGDVEDFLLNVSLRSAAEKKQIISQLKERVEELSRKQKHDKAWEWVVLQNRIVQMINRLVYEDSNQRMNR